MAILEGDALTVLRTLDAESVHAVVTDPPYGLSFMGKDWDHGVPGESFWRAALRVAKPGAHLVAFGGTRTHHRLMVAIEDAGWEIRDVLGWLYGSGFPKSHNLDGEWEGYGTALKPAWEPIVLARKPLVGTVAENMRTHGCGALHIDACRIEGDAGSGVWGSSNAECQDGRSFNASPEGSAYRSAQHELGRWPANLAHDGSDDVLAVFPDSDGQAGDVNGDEPSSPSTNCYGTFHRVAERPRRLDSGSAARFFYCAKASRAERNAGLEHQPAQRDADRIKTDGPDGDNPRNRSNTPQRNHHPTVKPIALMQWLVRLTAPPGALVLDPFCGSGSTGIAASREACPFIGIELNPQYAELARRRIAADAPLFAQDG